jgi:ABC-type lipopolysaccharide export system ATPase subunit
VTGDALVFEDVSKRFGTLAAVDGVSLRIGRGEMFGLIGPDGAGKTTAIRLACGLLRPDRGTVRVGGRDPVAEHRAITGMVGYLSQRFSLYGDLSIDENIAFQAEIHGVRGYAGERDRLLALTQLTPFRTRRADKLSGGMKQKLALACTLIHRPEIMVLDDPASLQAALPGSLIEVEAVGTRPPIAALAAIPGVEDVQLFGDRAHVRLQHRRADAVHYVTAALAREGIPVAGVRPIPASLEDVFIHLVSRAAPAPAAAPSDR